MKTKLKSDYEKACNAYLKAFCKKHGYDYEDAARSWVGGDVGGITECADYIVRMDDIITDIDRDAPEDEFVKYYDYCLRVGECRLRQNQYSQLPQLACRVLANG